MLERCVVKKIKRGTVYVELRRSDKCEGCKMCAFGKQDVLVLPTVCDRSVTAGEEVTVKMPTQSAGAAALLIYALPLLGILIGALIGLVGEWQLQLSLAAAGLVAGLVAIVPLEHVYRRKAGILPVVINTNSDNDTEKQNTDNGE